MRRDDPAAQLRIRARAARGGGGRVAARRHGPMPDISQVDPAMMALFVDVARREDVFLRAAAACHGNAIAMAVSREARAGIIAAIGEEARAFAIANRHLSGPARDDVFAGIEAARVAVAETWAALLPEALGGGGPVDPRALACLKAAA